MNHNFELNIYTTSHAHVRLYQEVTLLLIIEGSIKLVYEEEMVLKSGRILIINSMESVEFVANDEAGRYIELHIDPFYFTSLFPDYFHTKFECLPKQLKTGKRDAILLLRKYVAELCLIEFGHSQYGTLKSSLIMNQLLLVIVQHFQREHHDNIVQTKLSHKITDVLMYVSRHFQEELTIEKLAALFYMSSASLSKQFKKETGIFFSHYVAKMRVKHSLIDLCYSSQTIEEVAIKSGFSNSKTYRKQFRDLFHVSPTEYRLAFINKSPSTGMFQKEPLKCDQTLAQLIYRYTLNDTQDFLSIETARSHKQLTVHPSLVSVRHRHGDIILHVGCLEDLNSKSIQEEIKRIQRDIRVDYIGVQSLFHTIPLSYHIHREEKMSAFPAFERLDYVMDFLEQHHLSVFYDIYLPTYSSLNQETKQARINFMRHLHNQYGEHVLGKWKINLIFDTSETERYASAFEDVLTICHSINQRLEIGVEVPLSDPYIQSDFIRKDSFFVKEIIPNCHFLSYRADPNEVMRLSEKPLTANEIPHEYLHDKSEFIRQMMHQWEVELPLYLTEWNTVTGNTRNMNGTFFRGAIILKDILWLDQVVSGYGFWLNIEVFEQHRRMRPIANDSLELFHYYHGRRPVYFCLALAQRMKGEVLAESETYLLTKNGGMYQLLVWHTCYFNPDLSTEETFLQSQSIEYEWDIPEIPAQDYQIKQIDFSRKSGALFISYHDFQSVHSLDYETQRYIATMTQPKIRVFDSYIDEGFRYSTRLDVNAVMLLELTPIFFEL